MVNFLAKLFRLLMNFCTFFIGLFFWSKKNKIPPVDDEILSTPVHKIIQKIKSNEITCEQLVKLHKKRCEDVQPFINAIADEKFNDALEKAIQLDSQLKKNAGIFEHFPLFGIPITTRCSHCVTGMSFDCGFKFRKGLKSSEDSVFIKNLKNAGAIVTTVTNVPEIGIWWETNNTLHGRTRNPYDLSRTSGGSSGGEAALVSSAGSFIGIGSDAGGSIRIPAMFCGVFGHMISRGVLTLDDNFQPPLEWKDKTQIGPICKFASDIPIVVNAMVGESFGKLNLNEKVDLTKLKIFYLVNDSEISIASRIDKKIKESIKTAANHFQTNYGVEINEINLSNELCKAHDYWHVFLNIGEIGFPVNEMKKQNNKLNLFWELCKSLIGLSDFTLALITFSIFETITAKLLSKEKFTKLETESKELRDRLTKLLGKNGVLFMPTFPNAAIKHTTSIFNSFDLCYSMLVNVIGFPATQCPTGLDDNKLPIGFQVVAGPYNDRNSIAVAEELEKLFHGWIDPSKPKKSSIDLV